jgi:hypothetical protein
VRESFPSHDFVADLDRFFGRLPKGGARRWRCERSLAQDECFACFARHGVTHVFNSWQAMPPARSHGGNSLFLRRDPQHFWLTILQRVSPDMDADEVNSLEAS